MKYITSGYYNEFIEFEHDGKKHVADLITLYDSDYHYEGRFRFQNKEYKLQKELRLTKEGGTVLDINISPVD